jgi:8-oxo-dGTP pyrophosphatase MutT (NUDIX family)
MTAVPLRDAATVMLLRDDPDGGGIEVCMLQRNLASEFVAGAYVFPGGSVDPDDRGPAAEAICDGLTGARASQLLGVDRGGLGFWVAALRECFEEAGVLLARDRHGETLDFGPPDVAARFEAHRRRLNAGEVALLDVCREEGIRLDVSDVHFVSHWVTPELAPKRYDTRFFVAAAPPGQVARHDEGETIDTLWVRPGDALARGEIGEVELLPPTLANLRSLVTHPTTESALAWARTVTDVVTVLPIVLVEDGEVLVLRPGDHGYEQAVADRLAAGGEIDPALAAVAQAAFGPRVDRDTGRPLH